MAVFGAPEPLHGHAERALRCAIAMQARQTELNAEGWDVDDLPEMGVGIGVNTGQVIAGTVGGGGRLEYTVVGDAVNVASRLQGEAEGGEIVATADHGRRRAGVSRADRPAARQGPGGARGGVPCDGSRAVTPSDERLRRLADKGLVWALEAGAPA